MDDLAMQIAEVLQECISKGMRLPFIMCAASPNGSVLVTRFRFPGTEPDILAEHFETGGFRAPITIMILDQSGEARRITVTAAGRTWH